jgi:hypothetical protein
MIQKNLFCSVRKKIRVFFYKCLPENDRNTVRGHNLIKKYFLTKKDESVCLKQKEEEK